MKSVFVEQFPDGTHWNIWIIENEKKEHFAQIDEETSSLQIGMLRSQLSQIKEISPSKIFSEIKKIIDWKTKKTIYQNQRNIKKIENQSIAELLELKAQELLLQFTLKTIEDTKEIFYYKEEEGIYVPAERMLESIIQIELKDKATRHNVNEILGRIERSTYMPREKANDPNLIPLKNGIFNVGTQKIMDFSPDYFFISKHPVEYNPMAVCPKINKFFDEICEGDLEKVWLLEKIAAYTFYRAYPVHKAFMMLGSGSNGKSVYLNLLRSLLGDEHVCAVQLQDLAENRFAGANLYRKNANIFADLESHALKSTGLFKALTGGDYVTCDQKFKQSFPFMNTAKLIFSCNQLPETKDESDAFMRRWVIVEFNRQFVGGQQNPNLIGEITTPEELSGFFGVLMRQLRAVLLENQFNDESIQTIREKYMRNANSVVAFIEEKIEFNQDEETKKQDITRAYVMFCNQKSLPKFQGNRFWKSFHDALGDKAWEAQAKNQLTGLRERVFKGISLIKEETINQVEKEKTLSDRIIFFLKNNDAMVTGIPLDFLYAQPFSEDVILVQDCVKKMKREGLLFELPAGHIRINKELVLV